ncbi:MAG: type IV toxin-antitoxin system AbiEi family antitoxin, partial [Thermodesulfobacteriota bacterium]
AVLGEPVGNVSKLLSDLRRRRWVVPVERGKYLLLPLESGAKVSWPINELVLASTLVSPYYVSFWTAIHYYGHTDQVPRTVFVATTRRKGSIELSGRRFQFVKLAGYKFFGYQQVWVEADRVHVASPEKLLVDCLDLPKYSGGIVEVSKFLWRTRDTMDWSRVLEYCTRMRNGAISKRLGFLLEFFSIRPDVVERLQSVLSAGYALLDPTLPKSGPYSCRWRLQVNVPEQEIASWRLS